MPTDGPTVFRTISIDHVVPIAKNSGHFPPFGRMVPNDQEFGLAEVHHQRSGQRRPLRLLTSKASTRRIATPNKTGVRRKKSFILPASMITTGLAPAGGCTVRESSISAITRPTASPMLQMLLPNSHSMANPTDAVS